MNIIRRDQIAKYILEKGAVSVKEIKELFPGVSAMTIHRDLVKLESDGVILRTRGGAMPAGTTLPTEAKLESRLQKNLKEKSAIARKALELVKEGDSIFFDAGTTIMALAQILPDQYMNIITIGPNIAVELSRLSKANIQMCGGTMNTSNQAVSGAPALAMLEEINIGTAFIGVSGFTAKSGFTCGNEGEMRVKELVIKKAAKCVMLMDGTKYGRVLPFTFCGLEDVDYIVGDGSLPEELLKEANAAGVVVL